MNVMIYKTHTHTSRHSKIDNCHHFCLTEGRLDNIIFNFWGPLHSPRSMIQKAYSDTYSVALSAIAHLAIRT
jgi:hypothetical protein